MNVNYNILSKYRSYLMGVAMIMVVMYHSTIINTSLRCTLIKNIGNSGVDIFLFVSGIGMYFSLMKSNDIGKFYKRRLLRLVPIYFPIAFLYSLYLFSNRSIDFKVFLLNSTALSLWFNEGFQYWYISAIIVLYIMTPLYMKYFFKYKNKALFISLSILIIINIFCQLPNLRYLRIFTTRIPIYIIGIKYGELCYNKKTFGIRQAVVYVILAIIGFKIFKYSFINFQYDDNLYSLEKIAYVMLTVPVCLFIACFIDKIVSNCNFKFQLLNIVGIHTLEIYSFHERVLDIFKDINIYSDYHNLINNMVVIIVTFCISILWHKFIQNMCSLNIKLNKNKYC